MARQRRPSAAREAARQERAAASERQIATLTTLARALLAAQSEAKTRMTAALDDVAHVYDAWVGIASPALADRQRDLLTDAVARYFAASHHVRPVKSLPTAIALLGAASRMSGDDVARALLGDPNVTSDVLRDSRERQQAKRARARHQRAVKGGFSAIACALDVLADPNADARRVRRARMVGWRLRCSWGSAYLNREAGYPRSADAEHSMLLAARVAYFASMLPTSRPVHRLLVFVVAVAIAHVGPPPEITAAVLAVLAELPDTAIEQVADTLIEIVHVIVAGDGAIYAAGIDAIASMRLADLIAS